jgi:hypothetical protein
MLKLAQRLEAASFPPKQAQDVPSRRLPLEGRRAELTEVNDINL